ncbi:uncharacterized protein TNCV_2009901 [Trichonephila clavipes]|nr:uncharacterized protein TNCV_2009901 [Trichonephila clavipes]
MLLTTLLLTAQSPRWYSALKLIRISDTNLGPSPGDDLSNKHMINHWVSPVNVFDSQYPLKIPVRSRTRKNTIYHKLLKEFLSISKLPNPNQPVKHNTVHHITKGLPLVAKPRRLSPDRLKITKTELQNMRHLGHLRPSKSRLESGQTQRSVADAVGIARSVVARLWNRFQETGNVRRQPGAGRPRATTSTGDRYIQLTARRVSELILTSHCSATRGLLATDHVILNHGQVTWTTPELAPPLLTTTPHQREDVSALDRFNVHRCPTRRVFSGTGIELMTCLPWLDTLTTGLPQPPNSPSKQNRECYAAAKTVALGNRTQGVQPNSA